LVHLEGKEATHATKVLRLRESSELELCDGKGNVSRCTILSVGGARGGRGRGGRVTLSVLGESRRVDFEGVKWNLCVASGSLKGSRGDWLVEKATELGAWSFQPILTDHSSKMGGHGAAAEATSGREERWKRLAVAASKQSLRPHFLHIKPAVTLDDLLSSASAGSVVLAAHQTGPPLLSVGRGLSDNGAGVIREGTLLVGPEGDFSARELDLFEAAANVRLVGLGDLRLRVETAAVALLAGARLMESDSI